jgi:hypothetical protein
MADARRALYPTFPEHAALPGALLRVRVLVDLVGIEPTTFPASRDALQH